MNSSCTAINDNVGVPNTSLQRYLNSIFPPLKCSPLKHLWYIMSLGEISNTTVRKTITENIFKNKLGRKSYLLRDKESYIVSKTEIEGANGISRDTNTIPNELQQVIHSIGRRDVNKTIKTHSALRYARRVIVCVNKEE